MSRAEGLDEGQPLRADVDADHLVSERGGDLHGVVTEAAGRADHGDPPAREDVVLEQLLDRAVRGEPAAGQRGLFVADAVGQLDQRLPVHAELLGEGAHDPLGLRAVARVAAQAVLAGAAPEAAAGAPEAEDDPVADRHVALGAGAELGDDADALVPQRHAGGQSVPVAAGDVQVRVAHARRAHPDQRLVVLRRGRRQVLDADLPLHESCCLHVNAPCVDASAHTSTRPIGSSMRCASGSTIMGRCGSRCSR